MQREPNGLLAAVMAEAGVSNKGLAARVRALAERGGHLISSDHVSVRRWLDGSVPRGRTAEYIALALGAKLGRRVTPADLGMATGQETNFAQEMALNSDPVASSQHAWRAERQHLMRNRAELATRAVQLYEPLWRLSQAPMLSQHHWLPNRPIPLEDIELEWEPSPQKPIIIGLEPEARSMLPLRTARQAFPSYSSAIRYLDSPELFENRPCYRLLGASLSGPGRARLRFGRSCFFDKIDMAETLGHELAAAGMNDKSSWSELPFRSLISDPFDFMLRTVNTSITTLTIRREPASGLASFFLHLRDPTKVVTGGGQLSLLPSGEFQPASISQDSVRADLSIWRNIVREFSEELLGQLEHDGSSGRPLDYENWPFFRAMQKARERGELRVQVLGVALNALNLNATVLTVAVIDSLIFDTLFRELAQVNAEGEIIVSLGDDKEGRGVAFDEATINYLLHVDRRMSPSAIAGLVLGWRHRAALLEE